jgi:hypothetical protein
MMHLGLNVSYISPTLSHDIIYPTAQDAQNVLAHVCWTVPKTFGRFGGCLESGDLPDLSESYLGLGSTVSCNPAKGRPHGP